MLDDGGYEVGIRIILAVEDDVRSEPADTQSPLPATLSSRCCPFASRTGGLTSRHGLMLSPPLVPITNLATHEAAEGVEGPVEENTFDTVAAGVLDCRLGLDGGNGPGGSPATRPASRETSSIPRPEDKACREADLLLDLVDVLGLASDQFACVAEVGDETVAPGRLYVLYFLS